MKVTPLDIQQKRFHVAFRGYERTEVDAFLDTVREEMEALVREVTELREFHENYSERMKEYREREETLKNTMITTHKLAEDIKESSKKEAALIVKDAELKYQQMLERAREEKLRLEAEIHELKRKKHHFVADMHKMLEMHKSMLEYDGSQDVKAERSAG